jgi:hypothetical protein
MPNSIPEWHDLLLTKLKEYRESHTGFTFCPRRTDDARFKAGYWFQGTEEYLFCAPFKFNEPNNRTKTIGLVLIFENGSLKLARYEVVFGAPNCKPHLPLYQEVLQLLGVPYDPARWNYSVPAPLTTVDELVEDFAGRVIPGIQSLIKKFGYEKEYFVSEAEFSACLDKIATRKQQGLIPQKKSPTIPVAAGLEIVEAAATGPSAWLVGAYWDGDDMTDTFLSEGRWENGYEDRFLEQVKAVREGDRIAIKTTYVQKKGLPFDNQGRPVSCMQIKARGRVIGNPGDGKNLTVQWEPTLEPITLYNYTYRSTISRIDGVKYPEVVRWIFEGQTQPLPAVAELSASEPADDAELAKMYGSPPRNVIFYGPPGTGKTRTLIEEVLPAYTDEAEREPEELHLTRVTSSLGWFEVIAAVLIDADGKPLRVPQIRDHRFVAAKLRSGAAPKHLNQLLWAMAQNHAVLESVTVKTSLEQRIEPLVFDKNTQSEWSLVPHWKSIAPELADVLLTLKQAGTDKPGRVERFEFVTFHPSFSYEDFVEGLRPVEVEHEDGTSAIEIQPRDGALKRICKRAKEDPDHRYALVIDEINRGNIAKIFGELITLVEPDKRVRYDDSRRRVGGIEVNLPCTGEPFGVPDNVDLYGTMNTSDRSIALVDLALRRRFIFRAILPNADVIEGADGNGLIDADDETSPIDLRRLLRVLNARLTVLRGPDACIGHAYLTSVKELDQLRAAFRDRIIPLLQEYFFEDWEGISRVLTVKKGAVPFVRSSEPQISALFGAHTSQLDDLVDQAVWHVAGEFSAESFRALYDSVPDAALQIA